MTVVTFDLRTVDGTVIDVGYHSNDITKVQLGSLPAMTVQQFTGYIAHTLGRELFPRHPEHHEEWAEWLRSAKSRLADVPTIRTSDKYFAMGLTQLQEELSYADNEDMPGLLLAIAAADSPAGLAIRYATSPFHTNSDGTVVSFVLDSEVIHKIKYTDFVDFALNIMSGGLFGWDRQLGAYQEVKDTVDYLIEVLEQ